MVVSCAVPATDYERITLAHGGGGRLMHRLIEQCFISVFDNPLLNAQLDGAVFSISGPMAMATDGFTVDPIFFPGGDIGSLAVHGTANDVAMCGARPFYLSASFIIEEGFLVKDLLRVSRSMAETARQAGIPIVTGDTKVVEQGRGHGLYITTTGVGPLWPEASARPPSPERIESGHAILVSGPVGDHGAAVVAMRENLEFGEAKLVSDSGFVFPAVAALYKTGVDVICMRDPTRGGLATVLCELSKAAKFSIRIQESAVPVRPQVRDVSTLLGLDPLYMPCEGQFVAVVPRHEQYSALRVMQTNGFPGASIIGSFEDSSPLLVQAENEYGSRRVIDMLAGEQLPRIC